MARRTLTRIKPALVLEAYKKTGITPAQHNFLEGYPTRVGKTVEEFVEWKPGLKCDGVNACGLSVVAIYKSITKYINNLNKERDAVFTCPNELDEIVIGQYFNLEQTYLSGFIAGFDEIGLQGQKHYKGKNKVLFLNGYTDGAGSLEAVKEHFKITPPKKWKVS